MVDVPQGSEQPHARVEPIDAWRVGQQRVGQCAERLQVPAHVHDVAICDRRNRAAFLTELNPGTDVEIHADSDQSIGLQLVDLCERRRQVDHTLGEHTHFDAVFRCSLLHDFVEHLLRLG